MVLVCLDWPMGYTQLGDKYGDITFALAPLFNRKNKYYKETLKNLNAPIMLDNGAWESKGSSIDVERYIEIILELKPTYCVIPDVYEDRKATEKIVTKFFSSKNFGKIDFDLKYIIVPQGKNIKELVKSYNELANTFGPKVDIVGIPKHVGKKMNRIAFTDHLLKQAKITFKDVHFLGYNDFEDIAFERERRLKDKIYPWNLLSIDTKYPVKWAFDKRFKSQMDYYTTIDNLPIGRLGAGVQLFKQNLVNCGWK